MGEATDTDGCLAATLPVGTPVEIDGASRPGTLAYSSWATMQAVGETDPDACAYNDLALVRVDPADHAKVNPSIPHWGGPTGLNTTASPPATGSTATATLACARASPSSPQDRRRACGTNGDGWTHPSTPSPRASPVTRAAPSSTSRAGPSASSAPCAIAPTPLSNNVSDLSRALGYMHAHGGPERHPRPRRPGVQRQPAPARHRRRPRPLDPPDHPELRGVDAQESGRLLPRVPRVQARERTARSTAATARRRTWSTTASTSPVASGHEGVAVDPGVGRDDRPAQAVVAALGHDQAAAPCRAGRWWRSTPMVVLPIGAGGTAPAAPGLDAEQARAVGRRS